MLKSIEREEPVKGFLNFLFLKNFPIFYHMSLEHSVLRMRSEYLLFIFKNKEIQQNSYSLLPHLYSENIKYLSKLSVTEKNLANV